MTNTLEEYNKNRLEEWNKSTIKRHQTKPYYKCRNMKQFKNLIKDDKIQSLILEMTDRIVEKFKPDAVILHGSYAKGTAKHTSDIDLAVVFPKRISIHRRFSLAKLTASSPVKFDLQPTCHADFTNMAWRRSSIYNNVIRQGFHLYEKGYDASIEMLKFANDCLKCVKNPKLYRFVSREAYYTIKRSMTAIFIAEGMTIPESKNLDKMLKIIPTGWNLAYFYEDFKKQNNGKLDDKELAILCEKFYKIVIETFKERKILI